MWRVGGRGGKPWNLSDVNFENSGMTWCLPSSVRLAMRKKAKEMIQSDDNSNQKPDSESHQDKLSEATTSMPQSRMHKPKAAAFKKKRRTARRKKKNQQVVKKVKTTT